MQERSCNYDFVSFLLSGYFVWFRDRGWDGVTDTHVLTGRLFQVPSSR
jgi:hypothetical protein